MAVGVWMVFVCAWLLACVLGYRAAAACVGGCLCVDACCVRLYPWVVCAVSVWVAAVVCGRLTLYCSSKHVAS